MTTSRALVFAAILAASTTACAPGANELDDTPNGDRIVAGFGRGVWHGAIAPVTFVVSLFDSDVGIYEAHNIGHWYDFGFLLGMSIIFGGGQHAATRPNRRRAEDL